MRDYNKQGYIKVEVKKINANAGRIAVIGALTATDKALKSVTSKTAVPEITNMVAVIANNIDQYEWLHK